ncbi:MULTISPECIES: SurA N-terminal domain-containing protein [unclassified Thioalkalivibrio]|uniref:SurA N-terminal domain-containing protein n=1 Tax=unclassified Thioalkalivibrio TaxID=2621013 RepID=UPI0003723719|nr:MULTISPECIES: SurA N-terminal domain-containing protein [unclassified Thioalkalivibrio]
MLQAIRDRASGWLAYVIIGLITIPFAVWGLGEYFGGSGPLVAAEVNGTDIQVRDVHNEARAQRDQMARMFGGQIPDDLLDEEGIRMQALETLIRQELLRQAADSAGFKAAGDSISREIRGMPVFQEGGQFSRERYAQLLNAQRLSPSDFERDIGRSIILSQLQGGIQATGFPADAVVDDFSRLRNQTRVASWRIFPVDDFDQPDVVDDEAIEAYYEANQDDFTTEERVRIAYLQLDPEALEDAVDVSEDDIRQHYEVNRSRYEEPELREVRQIRIQDTGEEGEAKINELRDRLDDGEDFAELAEAYSEDSLSADRGGSLGEIARGDLDRTLETIIFTLPEGLISRPVRTDRGWFILEVTSIQEARPQPFEDVRDEVERDLRDRSAEQMQIDALDDLMGQAAEYPDSLEPASEATRLEIQTSDWFTRGSGDGIAQHRSIRNAAFDPRVLEDGHNSEAIDLQDGSTVVLRIEEHEPSEVRPLAEVEDEIRERLRREAAAEAAREAGEELIAQLRDADDWADAIEDDDAWQMEREVRRDSPVDGDNSVPGGLQQHLFRLSAPGEDTVEISGTRLGSGDFAVAILHEVRLDEQEADEAMRQQARELMRNAYASAEFRAYLAWLESEADIKRYPENLD